MNGLIKFMYYNQVYSITSAGHNKVKLSAVGGRSHLASASDVMSIANYSYGSGSILTLKKDVFDEFSESLVNKKTLEKQAKELEKEIDKLQKKLDAINDKLSKVKSK